MWSLLRERLRRVPAAVWWWMGIAASAAVLLVHARTYLPFIADDSLISLRYSQRLLQGGGLTWNDGERVEGYSNLTWVLACAFIGLFRIDLVLAARIVAAWSTAATLAAVVYAFRPSRGVGPLPGIAAALGLALSTPIAVWAVGGLEQPLVTAFAAWAIALLVYRAPERRKLLGPCVLLALLALSRPDGVMVAGLICAGVLLGRGFRWDNVKEFGKLFGSAFGAMLAQLAFRRLYYGDWVPNPARIKLALTQERLELGANYLREAAMYLAPSLLALALVAGTLPFQRSARARVLPIALVGVVWSAYVVFIGGDIFPARRHIVLLVVMSAFAVGELIAWVSEQVPQRSLWGGAAVYALVLWAFQNEDPEAVRARKERWEWDGAAIGGMLKTAFGKATPLLAVDPAGCLPFFSELPSIDMLGLNDAHIARHPPPTLGRGMLAHEFGDGKYVLGRKPDLALFCLPGGSERPCFVSGMEMSADPRFKRDYRLVTFDTQSRRGFVSRIWVRAESNKIGLRRDPNGVDVPGYLLGQGNAVARLKGDRLVAIATRQQPARLERLQLSAGRYEVQVDASGEIELQGNKAAVENVGGRTALRVDKDVSVDLVFLSKSNEPVEIERLRLKKSQ